VILLLWACAEEGAAGVDPTLANVQAEVFTPSCAFSTCHASPGASGLVLEEGASHGALVGVESADAPGNTLVVAGDAEGSYLVHKLRGDEGIVGEIMPQNSGGLEAELVDLVIAWIDAGAPSE
jgi:hypothetical protein